MDPELMREAREDAEQALDVLLDIGREDLAALSSEDRFLFLMRLFIRMQPSTAMLIAAVVVATERILTKEQLDRDLGSEG